MLSFFPLDVLDGILDVIVSVSEEFLSYSSNLVLPSRSLVICFCGGSKHLVHIKDSLRGDFRCCVLLFVVFVVIYMYKNR